MKHHDRSDRQRDPRTPTRCQRQRQDEDCGGREQYQPASAVRAQREAGDEQQADRRVDAESVRVAERLIQKRALERAPRAPREVLDETDERDHGDPYDRAGDDLPKRSALDDEEHRGRGREVENRALGLDHRDRRSERPHARDEAPGGKPGQAAEDKSIAARQRDPLARDQRRRGQRDQGDRAEPPDRRLEAAARHANRSRDGECRNRRHVGDRPLERRVGRDPATPCSGRLADPCLDGHRLQYGAIATGSRGAVKGMSRELRTRGSTPTAAPALTRAACLTAHKAALTPEESRTTFSRLAEALRHETDDEVRRPRRRLPSGLTSFRKLGPVRRRVARLASPSYLF